MESLTRFYKDVNIINQINEESMIVDDQSFPKTVRKQHYSNLSNIIYKDRIRTFIGVLLFFFVFLFPALVSGLGRGLDNRIYQVFILIYILGFLFLVEYLFIAAILVITILFQITYRTRCIDFFFQLLIYFQFIKSIIFL